VPIAAGLARAAAAPIASAETTPGGELFVYVARGPVFMNPVGDLLGRWVHHPKRQTGLPIVKLENGTYPSKRFGGLKPKPVWTIVGWVDEDRRTAASARAASRRNG
jgi:hypothetical protein